ncbi:MAG: HTTM domain-containing protein [Mycobacteriales bacterium]
MTWLFAPGPRGRIAALRTIAYLFIPIDVLLTTSWVGDHADVPGTLYQPLFVGRLLRLPPPGPVSVRVAMAALLVAALVAVTGRYPRLLGAAVAALYAWWMLVAMSYGKVDHDRFAFLVLLAVLPTVGAARQGDTTEDEASGWALRCVQLAVVATYLLAAVAKFRFGGLDWATGATLSRAILRRGTMLSEPLLEYRWLLVAMQFAIIAFELASPILLVGGRVSRGYVVFLYGFQLATFAGIGIIFLPHLVAMLAFLPVERVAAAFIERRRTRGQPVGRFAGSPDSAGAHG